MPGQPTTIASLTACRTAAVALASAFALAGCGTERSVNVEGDSNDRFASVAGGQRQNYWGVGGEQAELLGTNLADRSDEDPTVTDPDFPVMGNMPGFGPNW
jgi:hypothetical protein